MSQSGVEKIQMFERPISGYPDTYDAKILVPDVPEIVVEVQSTELQVAASGISQLTEEQKEEMRQLRIAQEQRDAELREYQQGVSDYVSGRRDTKAARAYIQWESTH